MNPKVSLVPFTILGGDSRDYTSAGFPDTTSQALCMGSASGSRDPAESTSPRAEPGVKARITGDSGAGEKPTLFCHPESATVDETSRFRNDLREREILVWLPFDDDRQV